MRSQISPLIPFNIGTAACSDQASYEFERTLPDIIMDLTQIRERIEIIQSKRQALVKLLEQPNLGTLRIDVNQALEEMDDLLDEFDRTFPEAKGSQY